MIWVSFGKNGQLQKFKIITEKNIIEEISKLSVNSIGDLLEKAGAINKLLEIDDSLKLMGIVSLGYGRGNPINVGRKNINNFLI